MYLRTHYHSLYIFSDGDMSISSNAHSNNNTNVEPYTLAIHSVKVRRSGVTVEAKALWDLGLIDRV